LLFILLSFQYPVALSSESGEAPVCCRKKSKRWSRLVKPLRSPVCAFSTDARQAAFPSLCTRHRRSKYAS
jgi:hypothetical protein